MQGETNYEKQTVMAWVCLLCDHPPVRSGSQFQVHQRDQHGLNYHDSQTCERREVAMSLFIPPAAQPNAA